MTPVMPPNRNVLKNPKAHNRGVSNDRLPPHMVPIQLKNFTPVGTAIKKLMNEKNARLTEPVTNIWWAHTDMDRAAIPKVAPTRPRYPNTGLRLKTEMTSVMMPKNGIAMMYTSGWPKNQKRCSHKIGPPLAASKICAPSRRSASKSSNAAPSTGNAINTMRDVTSVFQQKIGMRNNVIPGARIPNMVTIRLTAPRMVPIPDIYRPTVPRSPPTPGELIEPANGAYENQPALAAPEGVKNPDIMMIDPKANAQSLKAFSRGNATSGAPICNGITALA